MLFFIFLSLEHIFTFPSVKQRAMSDALFGIYPDSITNVVWNPAFMLDANKYWLDLLRLKERYGNFIGYRTVFPIIHNNRVSMGGMIFLSEEMPWSGELQEHNRGEMFFGYNGSIKYGTSVFVARKDWWYEYPWREGWNYIVGAKFGFIFPSNTSFSIMVSTRPDTERVGKEDTVSTFELLTHFSHTSHNYGFAFSLPHKNFSFIRAYHINHLQMGKFIKAIRIEWNDEEIKYFIPLVLDFNAFKQLNLHGGYTIQIEYFEEEVAADNFISMGFTYKLPKWAVTVNMGEYPSDTRYWEVSFSYGH